MQPSGSEAGFYAKSKNSGLFPPHDPASFSKSGWELESNRENELLWREEGHGKMTESSALISAPS